MALNTFNCNYLTPLHIKGLIRKCLFISLDNRRHERRDKTCDDC